MLILIFMLCFAIYQGRKGASLWISAITLAVLQLIGVIITVCDFTTSRGISTADVLAHAEWGVTFGRFLILLILVCSVQALTRSLLRKRNTTPNQT
jgi:hypothetical protein